MRKFNIILFILLFTGNSYANNVVYLDIQFLINNSNLGKVYKEELLVIQNKLKSELKSKEDLIKKKEIELNNQKNVLKQKEFEKKLKDLDNLIIDYRTYSNKEKKKINKQKKTYSDKIIKLINPLLTTYVEKNNIKIVIEKKNVLIGIKTLDITNEILKILNNETQKKKLINEN